MPFYRAAWYIKLRGKNKKKYQIQSATSKIVKLVQNIKISRVVSGMEVRERTGYMEGDGE